MPVRLPVIFGSTAGEIHGEQDRRAMHVCAFSIWIVSAPVAGTGHLGPLAFVREWLTSVSPLAYRSCGMSSSNGATIHSIDSILVLDDDDEYLRLCEAEFEKRSVVTTSNASDAVRLARTRTFDLVFIDLFLDKHGGDKKSEASNRSEPFDWGIDVVAELRREHAELLLILVSGGMSLAFAECGKTAGANATVPKLFFGPKKIVGLIEEGRLAELEQSCLPQRPISLARNEWEHLSRVYIDNERNASQSARDLQIARTTLYRKLRQRRS